MNEAQRELNRTHAKAAMGLIYARLNNDVDATYRWFRTFNMGLFAQPAHMVEMGAAHHVLQYIQAGGN